MPPNLIMPAAWTTGRPGPLEIASLIKNILEKNVDKVYHNYAPLLRSGLTRPTVVGATRFADFIALFLFQKKRPFKKGQINWNIYLNLSNYLGKKFFTLIQIMM